jgi:hypothetical protein
MLLFLDERHLPARNEIKRTTGLSVESGRQPTHQPTFSARQRGGFLVGASTFRVRTGVVLDMTPIETTGELSNRAGMTGQLPVGLN